MVRINLLPVRAAKKRELGQQTVILFGVVILGVGIANYLWYAQRADKNAELVRRVQNTQAEIRNLEKVIGEVQNITRDKKSLEDKLRILETLKRGRTGPVRLLDAVGVTVPKRVWLTSMAEVGGTMTFEGLAISHEDLAELMRGLQNVVWTPRGLGRVVEGKPGSKRSRVEMIAAGSIEDLPVEQVTPFFTDLNLKKATQREEAQGKIKVVEFSISCKANYST